MKLLIISDTIPASSKSSGSNRIYNLVKNLNPSIKSYLCYFENSKQENLEIYESYRLINDKTDSANWLNTKIHKYLAIPHFILKHKQPELLKKRKEQIKKYINKVKPDAILINGITCFQYIEKNSLPIITDFCDCISLRYKRESNIESGYISKLKLKVESFSIKDYERKVLEKSSLSIAISDLDLFELKKIYSKSNLKKIGLGVDFNYFKAIETSKTEKQIIFTGVMAYEPNDDAARYFSKEVFPLILEKHPQAKFIIVGSNPTKELLELNSTNIKVTGFVDDIRDYINKSDIFVSPLRFGTGVKNKILNAWAMRIPVIATDISLEGIKATERIHYLRANSTDEFIKQINKLFDDKELKAELTKAGYGYVTKNHGWEAESRKLSKCLMKLIQKA